MAKNMARLNEHGVVINIEWYADEIVETDTLVNTEDYPVIIGDNYENGIFYRNNTRLITQIEEYANKEVELIESYNEGVNSI